MPATLVNCTLILLGSLVGLLFRNRISDRFSAILMKALGLCVLGIGISSAIKTQNTLCVVVCMVVGTVMGEALRIEDRLDSLGDLLKAKLVKENSGGGSRFTEGFVTASVLFCVGAMAVTGAIEAGINHNYTILISKSVIDGITAISFAAAMGLGVAFSAIPILIYQGGLTLLAGVVGPYLSAAMLTEMSAVGGLIICGIALNMLDLGKKRIKIGNMLPAIFLPLAYLPISSSLIGLFL